MLAKVLNKIRPHAEWRIDNEKITWLDKVQSEPTVQEIEDGILLVQADLDKQSEKENGEVYTLNDVDYQIPFMKDDADGLLQVKAAFDLGVTNTVIYFTNGTKMPITAVEFMDFAAWFVNKRNLFFVGE